MSNYNAGDVNILQITLSNLSGTKAISIVDQALKLDLYESIMSPMIFGQVLMYDSVNIREKFPIIGHKCKIVFEFVTPPVQKHRKVELVITDVKNVTMSPNGKDSSYQLLLASPEILNNSIFLNTTTLKNKSIQEYVNEVIGYLKTNKQCYYDEYGTKGVQSLDPVVIKPFQVIDLLRKRAVSNRYKSSSYAFFENRRGFNFMPVEYLFERKNGRLKDAMFFFDSDVNMNVNNIDWRNVLAYKHITQESTIKLLQEGAFKNISNSIDLRTRSKVIIDYDIKNEQDNFLFADMMRKSLASSSFQEAYSSMPATTFNSLTNSKNPNNYLVEKAGYVNAFSQLLTQNIVHILVYGDCLLSAGYRIDCRIPLTSGFKKTTQNSPLVSGEYLISSIRHMFDKTQRWKYHISMELIRGTYGEALAPE